MKNLFKTIVVAMIAAMAMSSCTLVGLTKSREEQGLRFYEQAYILRRK